MPGGSVAGRAGAFGGPSKRGVVVGGADVGRGGVDGRGGTSSAAGGCFGGGGASGKREDALGGGGASDGPRRRGKRGGVPAVSGVEPSSGRRGKGARCASWFMRPPVSSWWCSGTGRSPAPGVPGDFYPPERDGIRALPCVRVTLRVDPRPTGTSPRARGFSPERPPTLR
ncbi:hypothetical protein Stsp02_17420 [Streptomyces sp. NBRC 14336]|nr:hypothetical protein Stsp02_17420 [Streptomyces sp. NBRC 14336]